MFTHGFFRYSWMLALLLAACAPTLQIPDAPQELPSPSGNWTLKLTQSGGFAGVNLTVQVSSDGTLTAENQRAGSSAKQTLAPETVGQLASQVPSLLQVTPAAPRSGCADCFLYRLEFTTDGKTARVEADDMTLSGSGVAELVKLLQQLRDRALSSNP
jgi:hypothetical protein